MTTREELLNRAKAAVKRELSQPSLAIMQALRASNDIGEARSALAQRVQEWLRLNFPELDAADEAVLEIAAAFGSREAIDEKKLAALVGAEKAARLAAKARNSFGGEFSKEEAAVLRAFAERVKGLQAEQAELEKFIEQQMKKHFPNISELAGPLLAARILMQASGIERLARMPASTIQVLGAEKALFAHLRKGSKPPKHGIIFQFAQISTAPQSARGKISRELATKLAIASRADAFTRHFIADKLKAKFQARVKKITEATRNA